MAKNDPRIDAYIAKSADFAKPILKHLREIVHEGCPDVEETLKWSMPHFDYHGGPLAGMAAFKEHCAFGFWKGSLIVPGSKEAMGQFGRLTSIGDLPPDKELVGYVRKAADLNERGIKKAPARSRAKQKLTVPVELKAALAKNAKARVNFEKFPPSHKREYCEWISGAKGADTRARPAGVWATSTSVR